MADFKKRQFGKRDSGRGGSDRGRDGGSRGESRGFGRDRMGGSSRPDFQKTFRVTCDKCGKDCDVPFKPTGDKPVYCSDCFRKTDKRSSDKFSKFESRDERPASNNNNNEALNKRLDAIEEKLDKILDSLGLD